mgnify:CR=1 FL=1
MNGEVDLITGLIDSVTNPLVNSVTSPAAPNTIHVPNEIQGLDTTELQDETSEKAKQ